MLVSSLSKPKTMEVMKPEEGDQTPYPQSKTCTLMLDARDMIYTYSLPDEMMGSIAPFVDSIDYSPSRLRTYIQRRQTEVEKKWGSKDMLLVIIKPLPDASYKNLIDVLDEILINNVKRYAIEKANTQVDSLIIRMVKR